MLQGRFGQLDAQGLMETVAVFLKLKGDEGCSCAKVITLMEMAGAPIKLAARILSILEDAGIIRHDVSADPCRLVFVPAPDEPGLSVEVLAVVEELKARHKAATQPKPKEVM